MTWLLATFAGVTIGLVYCSALRFAINHTMGSTSGRGGEGGIVESPPLPHPTSPPPLPSLSWFFMTSIARVAAVVALFFGLVALGSDIALWALVGFALARGGLVWWVGGVHGS